MKYPFCRVNENLYEVFTCEVGVSLLSSSISYNHGLKYCLVSGIVICKANNIEVAERILKLWPIMVHTTDSDIKSLWSVPIPCFKISKWVFVSAYEVWSQIRYTSTI